MVEPSARLPPGERLLESLLFTPEEGYFLLEEHLARLAASAQVFAVQCDIAAARRRLLAVAHAFDRSRKVRLLVTTDGAIEISNEDVKPSTPV